MQQMGRFKHHQVCGRRWQRSLQLSSAFSSLRPRIASLPFLSFFFVFSYSSFQDSSVIDLAGRRRDGADHELCWVDIPTRHRLSDFDGNARPSCNELPSALVRCDLCQDSSATIAANSASRCFSY